MNAPIMPRMMVPIDMAYLSILVERQKVMKSLGPSSAVYKSIMYHSVRQRRMLDKRGMQFTLKPARYL